MLVYEVKGPENKVYIGATKCNLLKRRREHKHASKTANYPLYKEIRQYGFDEFNFREICRTNNESELYDIESYLIKHYKETDRCYNQSTYRSSGWKMNEDQILEMTKRSKANANPKKMSEIATKAWADPEYRKKMSKIKSEWCFKNRKEMDRRRANSYKAMKEKMKWFVVEHKDGTFFGKYKCKYKCAEDIGVKSDKSIYRYLHGERSHKKFNLRYLEV